MSKVRQIGNQKHSVPTQACKKKKNTEENLRVPFSDIYRIALALQGIIEAAANKGAEDKTARARCTLYWLWKQRETEPYP